MEIIVGYLFGVLYYKRMLCLNEAILMSTHNIHLQDKRKKKNT